MGTIEDSNPPEAKVVGNYSDPLAKSPQPPAQDFVCTKCRSTFSASGRFAHVCPRCSYEALPLVDPEAERAFDLALNDCPIPLNQINMKTAEWFYRRGRAEGWNTQVEQLGAEMVKTEALRVENARLHEAHHAGFKRDVEMAEKLAAAEAKNAELHEEYEGYRELLAAAEREAKTWAVRSDAERRRTEASEQREKRLREALEPLLADYEGEVTRDRQAWHIVSMARAALAEGDGK